LGLEILYAGARNRDRIAQLAQGNYGARASELLGIRAVGSQRGATSPEVARPLVRGDRGNGVSDSIGRSAAASDNHLPTPSPATLTSPDVAKPAAAAAAVPTLTLLSNGAPARPQSSEARPRSPAAVRHASPPSRREAAYSSAAASARFHPYAP
ncbi:hypothetical protein HK405_011177, partial [Cladochytrium tenue]